MHCIQYALTTNLCSTLSVRNMARFISSGNCKRAVIYKADVITYRKYGKLKRKPFMSFVLFFYGSVSWSLLIVTCHTRVTGL
jgi:hypothetical protein